MILILQSLRDDPDGQWVRSEALELEIGGCSDADRRQQMQGLLRGLPEREFVRMDAVRHRAAELAVLGFRPLDALHLASAERAGADVLLTTDDRFQRLAARYASRVRVSVQNPLTWLTSRNPLA